MNMAGMAPVKATPKHTKDGIYEAQINFAMAGTWDITVSVQRPGQKAAQEKFTITAK
jgi:Cu(I)/Ag(I) efflux system membrane fusion protein